MNKLLRFTFVSALMLICGSMFAQEVTLDFTDTSNVWNLPTSKKADAASYTNGTYTIKLTGSTGAGYWFANTSGNYYLILGKQGAKLELPAFDFAVSKIEVVGRAGASSATTQNVFVGETAVSTEVTGATGTSTFEIADGYQAAGNIYAFTVTNGKNSQITKINIYKADGGSSTEKKADAALAFSATTVDHETGTEFTAPTFSKATTATVTFASNNESVAKVDAEGNITLGGEEGKAVITATSEENDAYEAGSASCTIYVWHYNVYKKATSIESGKEYLIVAQRNDNTYYAYPVSESKTYGYLSTGKVTGNVDEIKVKSSYDDAFTISKFEDGYSIKDCYGRYLYQSGKFNSFNVGKEAQAWTIEANEDGTFTIDMNGYYIQWGQGTYTSFGVYNAAQDNAVLPMLYVLDSTSTAINGVANNTTATKVNGTYNIAGQRVSDSYKGLVIVNGKKVLKK